MTPRPDPVPRSTISLTMMRRVARLHASDAGCSPFFRDHYSEKTWRSHFDYDLERVKLGQGRVRSRSEVESIVSFLQESEAADG